MSYGAVEANVLGETRVIVRYSVYGELDFKRVSAYMPVGQFRWQGISHYSDRPLIYAEQRILEAERCVFKGVIDIQRIWLTM